MSIYSQFAIEAQCVTALYLTTAFAVYADKMKSRADAHVAHLKALEACEPFDQEELLVRNGILQPMQRWALNLLVGTHPDSVWTVTFHDLLALADDELEQYDERMAEDQPSEADADWRIKAGSDLTFLRSLRVVAGEERAGRWEERKERFRLVVGNVTLRTKRSLSRLRETLRGKKDT